MVVKTMLKTAVIAITDLLQIIEKVYTNCESCGKTEKLAEMFFWQNKILCARCFSDELYALDFGEKDEND